MGGTKIHWKAQICNTVVYFTHLASVLTFYISVSDISSKTIDVIKTILYYVPCTTVNC